MKFRNALALLCSAALALSLLATPAAAAKRALFDNFHAETAGNADWTIDTTSRRRCRRRPRSCRRRRAPTGRVRSRRGASTS